MPSPRPQSRSPRPNQRKNPPRFKSPRPPSSSTQNPAQASSRTAPTQPTLSPSPSPQPRSTPAQAPTRIRPWSSSLLRTKSSQQHSRPSHLLLLRLAPSYQLRLRRPRRRARRHLLLRLVRRRECWLEGCWRDWVPWLLLYYRSGTEEGTVKRFISE